MPGIVGVTLAGENDDFDRGKLGRYFPDQRKSLVRPVRKRGEAEVDEGQVREVGALAQQVKAVRSPVAEQDVKVCREGEGKGFGDQRVVVDDQQARLFREWGHG